MKRSLNKGRRPHRYERQVWKSLERFHTFGLRLAGFMHQFKTPLHIIQSQAELLLEDERLSSELRRSLEMIHQNASRLAVQTQTMMASARGKENGLETNSLAPILESICHAAQTDCRKRNITLTKDLQAASLIRMDSLALEGALHNLVNNAIEATPAQGHVFLKTFNDFARGRVGIEISDSGKGMDNATLQRVIKSPFQSSKANGTGLGLYITQHILKRHKAVVRWQSKPGDGTRVTVLFPSVHESSSSAATGGGSMDPRQGHSGMTTSVSLLRRLWGAFALLSIIVAFLPAANFPQLLRLQGRFTDSKVPLTDNLPVRFSIWDTADGYGNLLWEDVQNVSVQSDTFQVVLGRSKPLTPSVFSGGDRWVELQIGQDAPMRPRHKIPNQYIQAQVAPAQPAPAPVQPATPPAPVVSDQERKDLEMQIEKYKEPTPEPAPAPTPAPAPSRHAKHKHVVPPVDNSGPLGPVYQVQAGDTLKSIAQKLYGNAELWYDLYYLNRDRLGPMGHLFPGQTLVLPTPGEHVK